MSLRHSRIVFGLVLLFSLTAAVWFCAVRKKDGPLGNPTFERLIHDLTAEPSWYSRFLVQRLLRYTMTQSWFRPLVPQGWINQMVQSTMMMEMKRESAIFELSGLGTNAWPVIPALLKTLGHKDQSIGLAAAEALAGIHAEEHPHWVQLQISLEGQPRAARVFHMMVKGRSRVRRGLDPTNRRFGLLGLAATGSAAARAYPDLIELVKSKEDSELRTLAVVALGKIKSKTTESKPILTDILQDWEEWPQVRAAAVQALADIDPNDANVRSLLQQARRNSSAWVRLAAARALWQLQTPAEEVLPVLTPLLDHRLVSIRVGALETLGELGVAAQPSRSEIERLRSDEDKRVRRAAAAALTRIDGQEPVEPKLKN